MNTEHLKQIGGQLWEKGEHRRWYLPTAWTMAVCKCSINRYGSGNISSATYRGEAISNSKARRVEWPTNCYVDLTTGEVHAPVDCVGDIKAALNA